MTGHFTTLDGCERWGHLVDDSYAEYYRVPYSYPTPPGIAPVMPRSNSYAYRMYKLESVEHSRGLAHYVEVLQ